MELTLLQRHCAACAGELETLEKSKTSKASVTALSVGIIGTAFMASSVFAVVHEPPIIWLCVLLAVPGFSGWVAPFFLYQRIFKAKTKEIDLMIETRMEEIHHVCEKGHSLL